MLGIYCLSEQRYDALLDVGLKVLRAEEAGGDRGQVLKETDVSKYVGTRRKLFRYEQDCRAFLTENLTAFGGSKQFLRVMIPDFGGALHELDNQREKRPAIFEIGCTLQRGLQHHLEEEAAGSTHKKAAEELDALLVKWEGGRQGKTSGTEFAPWRRTLTAAKHFVQVYGTASATNRPEKRARLQDRFPYEAHLWQKPVDFLSLGRGVRALFGEDDVRAALVFLAQAYVLIRKLFELHRASKFAGEEFDWEKCRVIGFHDFPRVRAWSSIVNSAVDYRIGEKRLDADVTFFNSCQFLRLHCIDSIDDPVQATVRENILACSQDCRSADRARTILRAVMLVHATRHYEFSSCFKGASLLKPEDVIGCVTGPGGASKRDLDLVRRSTSEGRFLCGRASQPFEFLARSNVMDTFPGCEYHKEFEQAVRKLNALGGYPGAGDAQILDNIWDLIKGFQGYGGKGNDEHGNVKGFVAKNVVYQGLRNILHAWGTQRTATNRFVSGPNPCKLVVIGLQKRSCSRRDHKQFYKDVRAGLNEVQLQYGEGKVCGLQHVDNVVLQDNLCKLVEVLQTTFTGLFFGKSRLSLDDAAEPDSDEESSQDA